MAKVPLVTFNNGLKCPQFGLGTFTVWQDKPGEVSTAVYNAIQCDYRHFDCAFIYKNEKEVGEGIARAIKEGLCKREDLFITTKLWNSFHKEELVIPGLKQSLENLNLAYVDLFLIHWPVGIKENVDIFSAEQELLYSDTSFLDTWKGMEQCVELGLTKSIGVSNFNSKQVAKILEIAKIKPVTNQVECHPYFNQKKLKAYLDSVNITLTAYRPLGIQSSLEEKSTKPSLLEDPALVSIADKHGKTPAQIALRWQIEKGNIAIPKSVTKSRIESNIQIFDFSLKPEDVDAIDSLDCNRRMVLLKNFSDHPEYPFHEEY